MLHEPSSTARKVTSAKICSDFLQAQTSNRFGRSLPVPVLADWTEIGEDVAAPCVCLILASSALICPESFCIAAWPFEVLAETQVVQSSKAALFCWIRLSSEAIAPRSTDDDDVEWGKFAEIPALVTITRSRGSQQSASIYIRVQGSCDAFHSSVPKKPRDGQRLQVRPRYRSVSSSAVKAAVGWRRLG